jgi:Mrp family chromosome partitioning ATPase
MTTTNQAFIKAYRHDTAQAAPASPAVVAAARPEAAVVNAPVESQPAAAAGGERSALYGPRPTHIAGSDARQLPQHVAHAPSEKRPLSSFIARPLKAGAGTQSADAEFLRPGTTVASFQWPPVCRALAQRCGRPLDDVADRLVAEAEAGRSLIGVVGLHAGLGASTIALCLAARLARRVSRLILVEANFRSPRLATWLDALPTTGWQDVLKRGGPLADGVIRATDDRFDLLALDARKPDNALQLVGGLQAVVTAGVLRHAYDIVLLDLGAYFDSESQPVVAELVRNMGIDAMLTVTGPEPPEPRGLETLAAQLSRSGCELLGTIENRVAKPQAA